MKITLTPAQIKSLHEFVQEEGRPSYAIEDGKIYEAEKAAYEG